MTEQEKQQIAVYRNQGLSYAAISTEMEISVNSIKSYCKRNGLGGVRAYDKTTNANVYVCENCGVYVDQNPGRKKKRFCSDKCRNQWWNSHLDQVKRKAVYEYRCPTCGKSFSVYGNAKRKYCSHVCYVMGRFGTLAKESEIYSRK